MNSLVIDTSTTRTSCATFVGNDLLFANHHDGATEHAEALPRLVRDALATTNEIEQVVVGMGPGPFTGLRVGIVFAQTFANARQIPWIGVCSLDGIDIDSNDFVLATDARRREIYWAHYREGNRVSGPNVSRAEVLGEYSIPKFGFGFGELLFPSPAKLLAVAQSQNYREPFYLRNPDAVPTSERK
jgi:tRNA threonylcarbamoyl adenosine modification protein YeaZ